MLYRKLVEITAAYLGPSADRFISRQIVSHLNKSPEKLIPSDLEKLIVWLKPAMAIITEDEHIVDSYITKLNSLSSNFDRNS